MSATPERRAFTLLELLLALGIIVAISSIALPGIFGALANRQLVRGGNGVRTALVQARLEAMRTGRTHILRVELLGSGFRVEPYFDSADVTEAADMMGQGRAVTTGGIVVARPGQPQLNGDPSLAGPRDPLSAVMDDEQLPDQVLFSEVRVQATARAMTMQRTSTVPMGEGWSDPVFFYADGTTSNAVITLQRVEVGRLMVRMRGLTGETDVSEVMP